jgi:penicillin-binding protein 2
MKISNELLRNYLITRRSFVLLAAKLGMLSILSLRMIYMQIMEGSKYKTLSDKNRINIVMLPPLRGKIIDRNGKVIADNKSAFRVMLNKTENPKYKDVVNILCDIFNLQNLERTSIIKAAQKIPRKLPGPLIDNLSWHQVSVVEENIASLPGVYIDIGQYRSYQYNNTMSHPIGYISILTEQDKKELELENVGDFPVGKSGVEKFYESKLQGNFGIKEVEVNAYGSVVREISSKQSDSGEEIQLNIDSELQNKAMEILPKKGSCAIVLDVRDGRVLTLASAPSFDANKFVRGLSHDYWNEIITDPHKPLINKTVQNNYPPGSIFKMIVVIAALEAGMNPTHKVHCNGSSALGDTHFKCWYKPGHGHLDLHQALEHSCNIYMYHIAKTIGADKIAEVARKFGFGTPTGIDLPTESAGLIPDTLWKKRQFKQEWHLGDSLNTGIGQGFVLATPIQIARFCAAIANGGKLITPRIVGKSSISEIDIDPEHLRFIQSGMNNVMNAPGGTAYYHRITEPGWEVAGKTGTSQVRSKVGDIDLSSSSVPWESRNHALFVSYGPVHNPRFATAVVVDHGGGGASGAGPIAKNIMMEVFKKYL